MSLMALALYDCGGTVRDMMSQLRADDCNQAVGTGGYQAAVVATAEQIVAGRMGTGRFQPTHIWTVHTAHGVISRFRTTGAQHDRYRSPSNAMGVCDAYPHCIGWTMRWFLVTES